MDIVPGQDWRGWIGLGGDLGGDFVSKYERSGEVNLFLYSYVYGLDNTKAHQHSKKLHPKFKPYQRQNNIQTLKTQPKKPTKNNIKTQKQITSKQKTHNIN